MTHIEDRDNFYQSISFEVYLFIFRFLFSAKKNAIKSIAKKKSPLFQMKRYHRTNIPFWCADRNVDRQKCYRQTNACLLQTCLRLIRCTQTVWPLFFCEFCASVVFIPTWALAQQQNTLCVHTDCWQLQLRIRFNYIFRSLTKWFDFTENCCWHQSKHTKMFQIQSIAIASTMCLRCRSWIAISNSTVYTLGKRQTIEESELKAHETWRNGAAKQTDERQQQIYKIYVHRVRLRADSTHSA